MPKKSSAIERRGKSREEMEEMYGKHMGVFKKAHDNEAFSAAGNYFGDKKYGELFVTHDKGVQCELLNAGNMEIDPSLLSYDQRMALYLKEFGYTTSAHGIPMIVQATNKYTRTFWSLLYLACMTTFWVQISRVVEKYNKMEKIVDIQLIFEAAAFPAITLCNLNPYRKSAASQVSLVQRTLKAMDDVMANAAAGRGSDGGKRFKRSADVMFEVARSTCVCEEMADGFMDCVVEKETAPDPTKSMCFCGFDRHAGDAWPCYPEDKWSKPGAISCKSCNQQGYCHESASSALGNIELDCLCQTVDDFCLAYAGGEILSLWEYYGNTAPTEDPSFLQAMGFGDMTDEVAIVTKAKENIVFAMSTLPMEERSLMSVQKEDFILKCSFNQKQCNIEDDFLTRVDPNFGNCFTYNHNRSKEIKSVRAGSSYGVRLVVYVNVSEYLPTTEAAGIKMTIHEKTEYPFPDTFGYNAPVGYVSSFGIKLKRMSRLSAPYGDCLAMGSTTSNFIYEGHDYTTEGCFRSCFQSYVIHQCHCGDPRFPIQKDKGQEHCKAIDVVQRNCLDAQSKDKTDETDGKSKGKDYKCRCQQPCASSTYSVTYSASVWPSPNLKMQLGKCMAHDHDVCVKHYKDNGAMIEVFYEQLSYELLSESPAYGFVNLLADFGGQFGLWLGVSVITCFEFLFLVTQVSLMTLWHQIDDWRKARLRSIRGGT